MHRDGRDQGPSDWELIGEAAEKAKGDEGKALQEAHEEVEDEEDEHLYHTRAGPGALDGVAGHAGRVAAAGEEKEVKTAIGAARAKQARNWGDAEAGC